ncbi:MAG: PepSY domain-containing protein [Gemmataceae bacterium]
MNLYRVIWRWHFYVGLILAPVLMVSAVTGLIYIFKEDVRDLLNAQAVFLSHQQPPLDPESLLARIEPDKGKVQKLLIPAEANRSWIVQLAEKPKPPKDETGEHPQAKKPKKPDHNQYDYPQKTKPVKPDKPDKPDYGKQGWHVDPSSGAFLGPVLKDPAFFKTVLDIHRRLLSGTYGRIVIELATSWAIVLMLTGLYLWWPKKAGGQGVWWPRLTGKGYAVFRDWHAVTGFYLAVPLVFILVTGLFFSYVWGGTYKRFQGKEAKSFFEAPKELKATRGTVTAGVLNECIEQARSRWPGCDLELSIATKKNSLWTILPQTRHGPKRQGVMVVDPVSREVVVQRDLSELSWLAYLRIWAYPIHTGSIWGWSSKLLAALCCLILIVLSASGLAMWWFRRKKGTLGLPRRPAVPLPLWLMTAIVLLAIALPVMGLSLLGILVIDGVLNRFTPRASLAEA